MSTLLAGDVTYWVGDVTRPIHAAAADDDDAAAAAAAVFAAVVDV